RWRVRPALQDICDINIFACERHLLENFRQQLSGASDEWFALLVLVHARRFANEHQIRVRIAHAKNGLRSRAGEMRAFRASADAFANRREQFCFVRRSQRLRSGMRSKLRSVVLQYPALQSCQRTSRCAWRAITRLSNLLQRRDNQIESWPRHLGDHPKFCARLQTL